MPDFMLTVWGSGTGARDIEVDDAPDMRSAIETAERITGCRVDHGRSGILSAWDPAMIVDYPTQGVEWRHDRAATESMRIANPFGGKITLAPGEGSR